MTTILAALACAVATTVAPPEPPSAKAVTEQLVHAFNDHDADAMAALVHAEFELYYVGNDGKAALAVTGPEQLAAEMAGYFEAQPDVRSEFEGVVDGKRFVAFRERIVGGASSLAVYEVLDGQVRRVWYYPAEP